MTLEASSKELSLFICKCSKLICRDIQMAFPLPAITLKSQEFRLCSSYRSREVAIPQLPPPFLSFPPTFWKIEKRYTLQKAGGSTANGKRPAHINSTWLPRRWRPASASQRQAKIHTNGTGLLNQVTMANSIFSFPKESFSLMKSVVNNHTHENMMGKTYIFLERHKLKGSLASLYPNIPLKTPKVKLGK